MNKSKEKKNKNNMNHSTDELQSVGFSRCFITSEVNDFNKDQNKNSKIFDNINVSQELYNINLFLNFICKKLNKIDFDIHSITKDMKQKQNIVLCINETWSWSPFSHKKFNIKKEKD